jgi:hypothetical protein
MSRRVDGGSKDAAGRKAIIAETEERAYPVPERGGRP